MRRITCSSGYKSMCICHINENYRYHYFPKLQMKKCVGVGILGQDEICDNGDKVAFFVCLYSSSSNKKEG